MTRRECTCAGTAPGYPAHEDWCGKPEVDEDVFPYEESDPCVSLSPNEGSMRNNETGRQGAQTPDGPNTARSDSDGKRGADPMMVAHTEDGNPQARPTLFGASPKMPAPAERHYFVPDETGYYCLACNLPAGNRRHAPRSAA